VIGLNEDSDIAGVPFILGESGADNYIWFDWLEAPEGTTTRTHIKTRPLYQARVTVLPGLPPTAFIRGDVNLDGELSLTDVVTLLSNLFLGSTFTIRCPDSADMNDDGAMDISDAVAILGFLFLGHAPPEPPYPFPGTDATDDGLPPCGT